MSEFHIVQYILESEFLGLSGYKLKTKMVNKGHPITYTLNLKVPKTKEYNLLIPSMVHSNNSLDLLFYLFSWFIYYKAHHHELVVIDNNNFTLETRLKK